MLGSFRHALGNWRQRPDDALLHLAFLVLLGLSAVMVARDIQSMWLDPPPGRPLFHIAGSRDMTAVFADQQDAIKMASQVNGVADLRAACGEGCTIYGAASASPVMAWIHLGGHEYPPTTAERIAKFFREHPRRP